MFRRFTGIVCAVILVPNISLADLSDFIRSEGAMSGTRPSPYSQHKEAQLQKLLENLKPFDVTVRLTNAAPGKTLKKPGDYSVSLYVSQLKREKDDVDQETGVVLRGSGIQRTLSRRHTSHDLSVEAQLSEDLLLKMLRQNDNVSIEDETDLLVCLSQEIALWNVVNVKCSLRPLKQVYKTLKDGGTFKFSIKRTDTEEIGEFEITSSKRM